MKRLILLDGNHLIHRAFHAIQAPLKTRSGEPTNALYGFASMLLTIIEAEKPDYLAVAFDEHAPTFRHEAHEDYKATRVKAPDELYAQIPRIHEMVERFGIPIYSKAGFEADDLLGTLAKKADALGIFTLIITGDRDALQLISSSTHVAVPHKGYRAPFIFDEKAVVEHYGIRPDQIADYKALMGDVSDNIRGVEGIGPKRAQDLLVRYGDLDGIYAHLEEVPATLRSKLEKGHEDAFFAQSLTRIRTDVPCDFDPEKGAFIRLHFEDLKHFFEEMEMNSLLNRLRKIIPPEASAARGQLSLF